MSGLSSKYNRRGFLKGLSAAGLGVAASGALAACSPAAPAAPTAAPKAADKVATAQPAATGPTKVIIGAYSFMLNEVQYAIMAAEYNASQDKVVITPELLPPGPWWQKMASEVKDKKVRYNALLYNNSYSNTPQFAGMGIVQPIEQYLKSSNQPDGVQRYDLMYPPAKVAATYKGQLYGVPIGIQYSSWSMRKDLADGAGVTSNTLDKSWDDVTAAATAIRKKYKAQNIDSIALQPEASNGSVSYMYWSYTDQPFKKVDIKGQQIGILDFQGEAFIKCLKQIKAWQDADLTVQGQVMDLEAKAWMGGVAAINMQESSLGYFAGLPLFGQDKLYPSVPLPLSGGNGCLTYYVNNLVPAAAPYPQEGVDFLLYVNDPKNEKFVNIVLNYHWYPVWTAVAKDVLPKDPRNSFLTKWADLIAKSPSYPNDHPYYNVNTDLINQHCTKFWTGEYKTAEDTAKNLDDAVRKATEQQATAF